MWFICSNANAENAFGLSRPLQLAPSFVSNMAGAGIINSNFFFLPPTEAPLADKHQDQRHRDEGVCARNHDAQVQPFHLLASFKKNPALGGPERGIHRYAIRGFGGLHSFRCEVKLMPP
jgi:hypothetical protein